MSTHTHRGHCQICLRVQAIDTATGRVALHGYTVNNHYFSGICAGSGLLSLHVERIHTDHAIGQAREVAQRHRTAIEGLQSGATHPLHVWNGEYHRVPDPRYPIRSPKRVRTFVEWPHGTEAQQREQVKVDISEHISAALFFDGYAKDMQEWADKIYNKRDAYRVEDLEAREWKVGDTVRIGGKKGCDVVIEEIADKPYRTTGFRQGSRSIMCPHARVTLPAVTEKRVSEKAGGYITREARPARVVWEALRSLKREPNALAEELKKAGKL